MFYLVSYICHLRSMEQEKELKEKSRTAWTQMIGKVSMLKTVEVTTNDAAPFSLSFSNPRKKFLKEFGFHLRLNL